MSLLGPSWLTFAGSVALAFAVGGVGGFFKGVGHQKDVQAVAVAKATEAARQKEANWQSDVEVLEDVHQTELRGVAAERDRALAGLRNRAGTRLPPAADAACAGASPASLSTADATVAVELAAEADRLRAGYQACVGWIETVRKP